MFKNLSLRWLILFFVAFSLAGCTLPQVSIAPTGTPVTIIPAVQLAETLTPIMNPVPNTLYLGTFDGQDAIFNTNSELQKYSENGVEKSSPMIGEITLSEKAEHIQPFDFKNLENPQPLFSMQDQALGVINFIFDRNREQVYVSFVFNAGAAGRNSIYRVTLATHEAQEVWKNEIGAGSRYGKYQGSATLIQAKGSYLVMGIAPCYGCDGTSVPSDTLLLNVSTGVEKVLGSAGNISVDPDTNKVSYQHLAETKTACDAGPGCNDGYETTYTPAGDMIEETLP